MSVVNRKVLASRTERSAPRMTGPLEKSLSLSRSLSLFFSFNRFPIGGKEEGGKKGRREKKRKKGKPRRYASYLIETRERERERESSRYPREDNRSILNKTFLSNDRATGKTNFIARNQKLSREKNIYTYSYTYILNAMFL